MYKRQGSSCSGQAVYGQVWIDGVTSLPGATPGLSAQLGFGPVDSTPDETWSWFDASFNVDAGNNDEYGVTLALWIPVGDYHYTYRYRMDGDPAWYYAVERGVAEITEACGAVPTPLLTWGLLKARW